MSRWGKHHGRYILRDREPVPCEDLLEWARWIEDGDKRRVGYTRVGQKSVSTVFLGLDHNWGSGPPILFETMVFDLDTGGRDEHMQRYSTWREAELGHAEMVAMLQGAVVT